MNECPRCRTLWMWFASFRVGPWPGVGSTATCRTCGYAMAFAVGRDGPVYDLSPAMVARRAP